MGKHFDEKYVVATMEHQPSQMIWGAMSCVGAAGLYYIPLNTTMNGLKHVELLKEKLKLHMHIHGHTIFMQNGALCHRSKVVTEFLKKKQISVLERPGNSADLNPTENLWTVMKDKVAYKKPSNAENVRQAIKEVKIVLYNKIW